MFYLIVNANGLRGKKQKKLKEIEEVFKRANKPYEILFTDHPGHAREHAENITSQDGEGTIVAVGGDGTLHEILNGFKDFDNYSLGIIPTGTGNDFAATAGIPRSPARAAEIIAYKAPVKIDYIALQSGLRSLNSVGYGIDSDVLKFAYRSKRRGKSTYFFALLKAVRRCKGFNYTVKYNGVEEKKFGFIAAIGNGAQFGGGIKMFPRAKIDDGKMNFITVDYLSKIKILGAFIKLMRGKADKIKGATAVACTECEIIPDEENFCIQAEGELYENMPIQAKLIAGGLKFYLP